MRIGIMSAAHVHADSYVHCLHALPKVELIGIADHDSERGQGFAEQHDIRLFESYDALLAEKPDGVIVCSENVRHREMTEMAAEAGVHVMCEKPLATTLEDARAMIEASEKADTGLMIAFPMRFSPAALEVKAALSRGDMGQVFCCKATNQGKNPDNIRAWFSDPALAGGGAVMDHTVHVADMLRWYLGSEVVEVYAEIDNLFYKDEVEADTAGLLMLTFENGIFASLDCSWSRPRYYPIWGNVKIDLICERGLLQTNYFIQNLTVYSHERQRPQYQAWGTNSDLLMVKEFVASIREERMPSVTGIAGLKATEVALAAYRSAEIHQPVTLPLDE